MDIAVLLICGAIGGAARGLLGYVKYLRSYKNVEFDWKYFVGSVGTSIVVGAGAVWVIKESGISFEGLQLNAALAAIIGYAGGDAVENIYKVILKKPTLGKSAQD